MAGRKRRYILEMAPMMVIAAAAILYVMICTLSYGRLEEEMILHREGWSLGGEAVDVLPNRDVRPAGEPTVISIALGEEFDAPRALCFYSVYENVCVCLDGKEIYRFDKPPGERMMKAAPSCWNQVSLPGNSVGKTLEIAFSSPYQQYANVLPEVRSGSATQVERYVLLRTIPRFVVALAILFIGLIFGLVSMVVRFYVGGHTGMYSLSLSIVVLAIFLCAQQTTLLLKINDDISYIMLQSVAFMLCPVMYARYLARTHRGKQRRIALGLLAVSLFICLLSIAFQIGGLRDMPQMMSYTRNLMAAIILFVFFEELRSRKRLLVCAFALLMIYAAFYYYFTDSITWMVYAGIFVYLFILLYRVSASVVRSQARQIRLEAALEVSKSEIATIQITSHFFYHTLDSIRALIRLDADKAYKMTGDFAKYIRHRVDGVERMQETVSFSRELRSIRAYTDIKQAQLGERFEMTYDVETQDFEILPLTVQPLVENAVIHAVQRRREGGWVKLKCQETDTGYHIEVIDNGPGSLSPSVSADEQKQSTAVKNVNTRLEFYGIQPLKFRKNEWGGMTVSLDTPKRIVRKGNVQ